MLSSVKLVLYSCRSSKLMLFQVENIPDQTGYAKCFKLGMPSPGSHWFALDYRDKMWPLFWLGKIIFSKKQENWQHKQLPIPVLKYCGRYSDRLISPTLLFTSRSLEKEITPFWAFPDIKAFDCERIHERRKHSLIMFDLLIVPVIIALCF